MAFKDGDFLMVEYSAWGAPDNSLIDTTDAEVAKKASAYDEKRSYGAVLAILGSSTLLKGLDRELRGMSVNEKKKFTFKPEEAFGQKDPNMIHTVSKSDFRANGVDPEPGMRVTVEGARGTIRSVSGGRVVVDLNHPYAGRDVTYEVKITKFIDKDNEKIEALGAAYGAKPTAVSVTDGSAEITFDSSVKKSAEYFISKSSLVEAILKHLPLLQSVNVHEEYKRADATEKAASE